MPGFVKGPAFRTPFGRNQYLRSTRNLQMDHGTVAQSGVPAETIDGTTQKVLQPGTIMARITSGADNGKLGVFDTTASDGRQTTANIVGLCNTFLPWQLLERDCEVAFVYHAAAVQEWCIEYVAGVKTRGIADARATAMVGQKRVDILWERAASIVT